MSAAVFHAATYILPIRRDSSERDVDLDTYIDWLAPRVQLVIVDNSPAPNFADNHLRWRGATHVPPSDRLEVANGKAWGVLTGLALAAHDRVVIGDDDVRYDDASLTRVLECLETWDIVRPQNYFEPLPWHAAWDSSRSLLNRLSGGDWPGTLAIRRSVLARSDGYRGDCLFENLEMVRAMQAAGGQEYLGLDLFVTRRPPTFAHFRSQRVRQAYDEFARPLRLAFQLGWLPVQAILVARRPAYLIVLYAVVAALAEAGRARKHGRSVYPLITSLVAPVWFVERSFCSWLAVGSRVLRGGITYRGGVMQNAATPLSDLRKRMAEKETSL